MGESSTQYDLPKLFKPNRDTQKELKQNIISKMKPIMEVIKNLPKFMTFAQFPSIMAKDGDEENEDTTHIRDIAQQYLPQFAITLGANKRLALWNKNGKFFIRNKKVGIKEKSLVICKECKGTLPYGS